MLKLLMIMVITIMFGLTGCGEAQETDGDDTNNTVLQQEENDVGESENDGENNVQEETGIEDNIVSEEDMDESVNNDERDESIEMVDWETWAKQEGNDSVCLVVWNDLINPKLIQRHETKVA